MHAGVVNNGGQKYSVQFVCERAFLQKGVKV